MNKCDYCPPSRLNKVVYAAVCTWLHLSSGTIFGRFMCHTHLRMRSRMGLEVGRCSGPEDPAYEDVLVEVMELRLLDFRSLNNRE